MPYYGWHGVNLFGDEKKGKIFARSEKDLDTMLFDQNIALMSCYKAKIWSFGGGISADDKIHFFRQMAILIDAGVRVPQALQIVGGQSDNLLLKQVLFCVESDIQEGLSFSKALEKHNKIFDNLMVKLVQVGQEAGNMSSSLFKLSDYLEKRRIFYKKLRSAATLPLITLAFFGLITMTIFVFIVPRFADVYKSLNKDIPPITKTILNVSKFLRSNIFFVFLAFAFLFILLIRKYIKNDSRKKFFERFFINFPLTGPVIKNNFLVHFLSSTSMLLESGMRLLPAIGISKLSSKNSLLKSQIDILESEVYSGSLLSESMLDYPGKLFTQDLIAMIKVGEETGQLGLMLKKAADIYQEKVNRSIVFFTTIFQPLLMIILGLLITLLIFAIYVPVLSLSSVV